MSDQDTHAFGSTIGPTGNSYASLFAGNTHLTNEKFTGTVHDNGLGFLFGVKPKTPPTENTPGKPSSEVNLGLFSTRNLKSAGHQSKMIIRDIMSKPASILTVSVDTELPSTYAIHEALICAKSAYFKEMMAGRTVEATTKTIKFEQDDADEWDVIVTWLYSGRLELLRDGNTLKTKSWTALYLIARRIHAEDLKDSIITALLQEAKSRKLLMEAKHMHRLYSGTQTTSQIRAFLEDVFAVQVDYKEIRNRQMLQTLPSDFKDGVMIRLADRVEQNRTVHDIKVCDYHEHRKFAECPASLSI